MPFKHPYVKGGVLITNPFTKKREALVASTTPFLSFNKIQLSNSFSLA